MVSERDKLLATELLAKAKAAIKRGAPVVYDVASETGQMPGNVGHMKWFIRTVAVEIARRNKKFRRLLKP